MKTKLRSKLIKLKLIKEKNERNKNKIQNGFNKKWKEGLMMDLIPISVHDFG